MSTNNDRGRPLSSGFYTIPEASSRLGVSGPQGYRMIQAEMFPVEVVKVGQVLKVRVSELEAFIQGSPIQPHSQAVMPDASQRLVAVAS